MPRGNKTASDCIFLCDECNTIKISEEKSVECDNGHTMENTGSFEMAGIDKD